MKNRILAILLVVFTGVVPAILVYLTSVYERMSRVIDGRPVREFMMKSDTDGLIAYLSAAVDFSHGAIAMAIVGGITAFLGLFAAASLWKTPSHTHAACKPRTAQK